MPHVIPTAGAVARAWRHIFTPEAAAPFLIGSLALSVAGNAAFALLSEWLGKTWPVYLGILVVTVLILVVAAMVFARVLDKIGRTGRGIRSDPPAPCRGLILLVNRRVPCMKALESHRSRLEYCWLLHSDQSEELACDLCGELERDGKQAKTVWIQNIWIPQDSQRAVDGIYTQRPTGLAAADIMLDFTGMTVTASIGAVLASLHHGGRMEYTPAIFDAQGRIIDSRPPVEILLTAQPTAAGPAAAPGIPTAPTASPP